MVLVMINTINESVIDRLRRWFRKTERPYIKDEKWFIKKLGPGTYLFDANGAILALLLDFKRKYKEDVSIYTVHLLLEENFPKEITNEVNKCQKNKIYLTKKKLEDLSKIRLDYFTNLNEI